jgi:hypothetical protein
MRGWHSVIGCLHSLGIVTLECPDDDAGVGEGGEGGQSSADACVSPNFSISIQLNKILEDIRDDILSLLIQCIEIDAGEGREMCRFKYLYRDTSNEEWDRGRVTCGRLIFLERV